MRYGADQNSRRRQELVQAQFFAITQILGSVHYHRRQPRTGAGSIRGEPDVGEKHFAILAPAAALHHGSKRLAIVFERGNVYKGRKILANRPAIQVSRYKPE